MTQAVEDETLYIIIADLLSKLMLSVDDDLDASNEIGNKKCVTQCLVDYQLSFRGSLMNRNPPVALFVVTFIPQQHIES